MKENIKALFQNRNYIFMLITMTLFFGTINAISTMISYYIKPFKTFVPVKNYKIKIKIKRKQI